MFMPEQGILISDLVRDKYQWSATKLLRTEMKETSYYLLVIIR